MEGAKRGKDTSMWLAIESVKNKEADIVVSAGNTGALLVISKLNLKMIENIDKPALSALWPNKLGMNVVLDLGANIECSEKNLTDFAIMGSSLFKSLFHKKIYLCSFDFRQISELLSKCPSFVFCAQLKKIVNKIGALGSIYLNCVHPSLCSHFGERKLIKLE